jgi:hypothetical protein
MKTIIPLLSLMFLVGCGKNNSMDQSSSTNSTSAEPPVSSINTNSPATNDVVNTSPAIQTTNVSVMTNATGTNIPATTNQ